jgi:hypothetical protein
MIITSHDHDRDHGRLAPLLGPNCLVKVSNVLLHQVPIDSVSGPLIHLPLLQHQQNRLLELVLFELHLHAFRQAIAVLLVREAVFDLPDLAIRAAHQGFDE